MTETALIIRGPLNDLNDVLHIAHEKASKIFKANWDDICVKPYCQPYGVNAYLVVVERKTCSNSSESVGGRIQVNK